MAVFIDGIRGRRGRTAPDGGAARRVSDIHTIAEQLGYQAGIRGFAAAGAGARELQQGLQELAALDGALFEFFVYFRFHRQAVIVQEFFLFFQLGIQRFHNQRFFALHARADRRAGAAARAIERRHGDAELIARQAGGVFHLHALGRVFRFLLGHDGRADDRVRADIGAEVALDAVFRNPAGHIHGDAAFFIGGRAQRHGAVRVLHKGGNRQLVALLPVDRRQNVVDVIADLGAAGHGHFLGRVILGLGPLFRHVDLLDLFHAALDGVVVHLNDGFALFGIGLGRGLLHEFHRIVHRDDLGQLKERRLENGVGAVAQAQAHGQVGRVDGVEFNIVFSDIALHGRRQVTVQLLRVPGAVEQEDAAGFDIADHVVLVDIGRVVAGHEVRLVDKIGRLDRLFAKAQVGNGYAA